MTHSTTKYMDGHATAVGGVIVDSGNFDWDAHADKFPGLTTPDESYHGLTYTKAFGKMASTCGNVREKDGVYTYSGREFTCDILKPAGKR